MKKLFILFLLVSFNCFASDEETFFLDIKEKDNLNCYDVKFNFDNKEYEDVRNKIIEIENLTEYEDKNYVGIAYYDLNSDGKNEILAKVCNIIIYGFSECIIAIYEDHEDNYEPIGIGGNFDLCISNKKTNDYYDLYTTVKNTSMGEKKKYPDDFLNIRLFKYTDGKYI